MVMLIQGVFAVFIACFALYVWLEFRTVRAAKRQHRRPVERGVVQNASSSQLEGAYRLTANASHLCHRDAQADVDLVSRVSVLLPVYNEAVVVERLIDSVAALRYPREHLEVLVLDDSTDHTTGLAASRVAHHAARGLNIRLIRRPDREGYKAGNLRHGIQQAAGDFLVIFDADFLPPDDFLLRTLPCFDDPEVGYLQTAIGYLNRDVSFLTRFQAMIMGHQQFVTQGLSELGGMVSLSGSACIWRRACVEQLGGWSAETITEDVDLGYRAQFGRWRYAYVPDVVCMSELPERLSEVRVQRDRWARGLVQNAFRHLPGLFRPGLTGAARLQAFSLMFSSVLLAFFSVMLVLALPLALQAGQLGWFFDVCSALFVLVLGVWFYNNGQGIRSTSTTTLAQPGTKLEPGQGRAAWQTMVAYVLMFLPLSLYYFVAALQVAAGRQGGFNRTPKGAHVSGARLPIDALLRRLERLALGYALLTLVFSALALNPWLIAYSLACCGGFGLVVWLEWQEQDEPCREGG